ncbi:MAG TPA: protein kinase, partial [Planctomycetaceae bacterium]|nr:protein kinase [Planctomycetaceae bacterium]
MSNTPKDAKHIFLAALEIADAAARAGFLEQSCGGDAALRQRVDALLHAYGEPGGPLDMLAAALAATEPGEQIREQVGTTIGAYRLMEQIGAGGFGLVFVADQERPIRRKVALKIIKPGMDSRDVIARFEAERQALALMDHPNIARVLDAGTTDSGRPYFVMELVHGIPITDYCDQNQLTPRERLELFVAVCNAVQHAHQKGIIHRDIKPSNVLVTLHDGRPVVKVIDFGVAKALHQKLTEHTIYTRFAQMIGTPLYMSPEQAEMSGLDIDTRSDVYSLGVLMYELLTGTTPFDKERFAKAAYNELIRIIREEEPPKPSTRLTQSTATLQTIASKRKTEPARLSRLFRGDLDWITMKALEKDRTRRYGSARELAEDIERWDCGDPIVAQPPTLRYLLGKYVRRNRLRLGIAAAVLLALIAGTVFEFYRIDRDRRDALESRHQERVARGAAETALQEAEKQRKIAEANLRKARQVVDRYFTLISEGPLRDIPGAESLRKELLSGALKSYQDFPKDESDDAEMQAELAASYFRMSQIEFLTRSADWLTESEKGLAILERLLAKKVPIETFKSFDAGIIDVSGLNLVLSSAGSDPRLISVFERGVRAWGALVARQPSSPGFRSDLATMHYVLGNVKYGQAQLAKFNQSVNQRGIDGTSVDSLLREALASKTKARDLWQQLSNERPNQPRFRAALASAEADIGGLYLFQQKHSQALKAYLNSYGLDESLTRDFPEVPAYRMQLANVDSALTLFYVTTGDVRKAADFMRRESALRAKMVADFPTVPAYKMSLEQTQRSNISFLCVFFSQIPARPKELLVVFDLYAEIVDEQIIARRTAGGGGNLESGEDQSSLESDPAFPTPTPYFGARAIRNFGSSFRSMSAGAQEEMLGLLRKRANEIDARGAKTYRLAEFAALWWSGKRNVAVSRLEVDARQMPSDPQFPLMLARARSQLDRSPQARDSGKNATLDRLFSAFTNAANDDESTRKIAETILRADPDAKLSSRSWLDVLDHRDALVRKRAIRALPEKMLEIESCVAQLEQSLSDPDPGVRMAAATRLSAVSAKRERIVDLLVS